MFKKFTMSLLTVLCMLSLFVIPCSAKYVPYGSGIKITVSDKKIAPKKYTKIKVSKKKDTKDIKRKISKVTYKNLTPSILTVSKNGKVKGKKVGTGKILVTVSYKYKERCYKKCIDGKPEKSWFSCTLKEKKVVKIQVDTLNYVSPIIPDIVGGSMTLSFECDGKAYGSPITVGVGISPLWDYKDQFPADPVKEGYTFLGWYTKKGEKIGTTAGEIYPAFNVVKSGQKATVYAKWTKS